MIDRLAPAALALMLASCAPSGPDTLSPAEAAVCEARGGYVGVAGISAAEFCAEPTPDAGQSCSRANQCSAYCDGDTRSCATHSNPFGCYSYLDETGQPVHICVD